MNHTSAPTTRRQHLSVIIFVAVATLVLLVGAGGVTGSAHATAHERPDSDRSAASTAVTWSSWRGARIGMKIQRAHHLLGGHVEKTPLPGQGCGDVLRLPRAYLDGHVWGRPHRISTIHTDTRYPLGLKASKTGHQLNTLVADSTYVRHHKQVEPYPDMVDVWNWVVGPHRHVLYYVYAKDSGEVYRLGLAASKKVAFGQMGMNGC